MKGTMWILNFLIRLTKLSADFSSLSLVMGFGMNRGGAMGGAGACPPNAPATPLQGLKRK
jgi:hypothetical protein